MRTNFTYKLILLLLILLGLLFFPSCTRQLRVGHGSVQGAQVYYCDEYKGYAPLTLQVSPKGLKRGSKKLEIRAAGYHAKQFQFKGRFPRYIKWYLDPEEIEAK